MIALLSQLPPLPQSPWFGASRLGQPPVMAHQVQIDRSVGATQHIEPNDTPRSGELSRLWFALTRQGGTIIPLDTCDCRLAVYPQPPTPEPLAIPELTPYSAEGYTNIPSAQVVFPQVGTYELVLTGQPRTVGDFDPFELTFKVTVAQGSAPADPVPPSPTVDTPLITDVAVDPVVAPPEDVSLPLGVTGGGVLAVLLAWKWLRSRGQQKP
ncbi:hypothetical protein [Prochlorothrix hollandica]|uniref:hypothetical protein n=1 Tax=Prochlorothrix hollandica TaxID=1223 RepID=UPI00333EA03D